jgi:protein-histidine pros-kinase
MHSTELDMQDPNQLRLVVEAAPIAIVVADAEGRIALVNDQACRLFGYDAGDLLGMPVESLVPPRFRRGHPGMRAEYLAAPTTRAMGVGRDLFGLRKDGTEVPIEIGLNPIATAQGAFTLATIADITERKNAEEHLRLIVERAPNANIVVDHAGIITLVNAQTERLFGYDRTELLGAPVDMLVPERFRGGHGALRASYHGTATARLMGAGRDLYGLRKDGTEVPVEIGLSPIRTPKGDFVLTSVVDITERKNTEEMRRERDRALDASNLKSQFVATMSHELRTPLNAIIASAELLSSTKLEERQRAFVETIDDSAEALLALISSILDFSKIEAGKLDLEARTFELEALVEGAAGVLAHQARQKGLRLHVHVDASIPGVLRGDADRLRQILLNLIANALKFTASGSVVVRAIPVETSSGHAVVRFEVEDTGIGIHPDVVPKLFEPFVQGDSSSSRRFGGTGLGLSISKRLAELMHGEIGVKSEPERGSLFWFTARFDRPSAAAASDPAAASPSARALDRTPMTSVRRVLVAEDNESLREILVHQFAQLGVPVTVVANGREAVDAVRRDDVALLFMDCHMPEMDGFAATRVIRANEDGTARHVPIVAMTANAFREDRDACLAAGMDDYLAKPVRIADLRGMIDRWITEEAIPPR